MVVKTKIKLTELGDKILFILDSIQTEMKVFKFASPSALRDYVRGRNSNRYRKNHISQKEIENFIKLLENNKLITVERK